MAKVQPFTNLQLSALVILRFLAGWHLLYEGVSKLLNPGWSAAGFLGESQRIMSGISNWIVSNNNVLNAVDFLNTWGLIAIGLGLILGLFTSFAAFSGAILLFIYYFNNAPIVGIEYTIPSEGNNLLVNKTLIEAMSLFVLAVFPTGSIIGLDVFINRLKIRK